MKRSRGRAAPERNVLLSFPVLFYYKNGGTVVKTPRCEGGFLKRRGVWLEYTVEDFCREGEIAAPLLALFLNSAPARNSRTGDLESGGCGCEQGSVPIELPD